MSNMIFIKRIIQNKIYWLSVMAAILLLFCSVIYTDARTGAEYTFVTLFYDATVQEALKYGQISLKSILMGYDSSYLWMFGPIIVGVPCVLISKTERFVLFRSSKNKYFFSKYFSGLLAGGSIVLIAYVVFGSVSALVASEVIWDMVFVKKLLSVFCWGVLCAVPSALLSEFVYNKYLILCIPFVLNYFMCMFVGRLLPYEVNQYISPNNYQILFLYDREMVIWCSMILLFLILVCGAFKKIVMERRCDCGQR